MAVTIGTLRIDGKNGEVLEDALRKAGKMYGLIFGGAVGSGKTTAATALLGNRGFMVKCYEPEKAARLEDWRDWMLPGKWVLLDDMGRDAVRNEYGNRCDVVGRFIRELYDAWRAGEWTGKLYVTTNLTGSELKETYDESIVSRIAEMCVPCKFAENHRAKAGSAQAPAERAEDAERAASGVSHDSGREDAFWDRRIASAKAESARGGIRNIALVDAQNDGTPDGLWHCAWKVAKNELHCWSATDCAIVGMAWTSGLGRPKPRRLRDGEQKPFELSSALYGIVAAHWEGEDDTARWFAARTLAWATAALGKGIELERAAELRAEWYGKETVDWERHLADAKRQREWEAANVAASKERVDFASVAGGL